MRMRWIRVVATAALVVIAGGHVHAGDTAFQGGWGRGLGRGLGRSQGAMGRGRWMQPESQEWQALADEAERQAKGDLVPPGGGAVTGRVGQSGATESGSPYQRDDLDLAGAEDQRAQRDDGDGRDDASDLADHPGRWPMGYGWGLWRGWHPVDYGTIRDFNRGSWPSGPMCYGRAFDGQRRPMRGPGRDCGCRAWRQGNGWCGGRGGGCGFGRGCGYQAGQGLGREWIGYGRGSDGRGRWPGMGFGRADGPRGGGWPSGPMSYGRGAGRGQGIGYGPGRGYDYNVRQGDRGCGAGRWGNYGFGRGGGRRGGGYGLGGGFGRQAGRGGNLGGDGRGRRLPMLATPTAALNSGAVRAATFFVLGGVSGLILSVAIRKRRAGNHT